MLIKKTKVDEELIKSLIKESLKKLKTNELISLNEITASTKITTVYDSLRELLEALALQKGYKVYNHECYSVFLNHVLGLEKESFDFDKFRRIRNSINYYGKSITVDDAEEMIERIKVLREEILKMLE